MATTIGDSLNQSVAKELCNAGADINNSMGQI
jgi:hypothetical protein